MQTRIVSLVLAILALTPVVRAQDDRDLMDLSLADLMKVEIDSVYGLSGYKQKVENAPASITIVTGDEIRRYGYQTLADVLRNVAGFYINNDRNYTYIGVRGFGRPGDYNSRILLLVDGHRANDNIYDQAFIGNEFPVDIDLIDRVEIIRGPNSSLYVASAFLGVINVITKPVSKLQGLTVSGDAASYGTGKSRLTYGREFDDGLKLVTSATYSDSAGQNLYFPGYGTAINEDYEKYEQGFATLSYDGLRLEAVYGSREQGVPTASYGTVFGAGTEQTIDTRGYLDLAYDHNFGKDLGFSARVYFDGYHYGGIYPLASANGSSIIQNEDDADGRWWGSQFAFSKRLFDSQTAILGAEFQDNVLQYQDNYDQQPYFSYFNSRPSTNLWAVYVQDEIPLGAKLTLDLGLRHDQYSTFGGATNPRAALVYRPFQPTSIKLIYGQSFRPPNAYELYYAGEGSEGNPNLRPETVKTSEIVIEQKLHRDFRLTVAGYYYPIRGLISQTTDPVTGNVVYENTSQVNLRGVETGLSRQSKDGIEIGGSVSLQDSTASGGTNALSNSPRLLVQGNISVPLFRHRILASFDCNYVSRRLTTEGTYAPGYFLPDFTLVTNRSKRWEISASVYNAFNQAYYDPGSLGDPEDLIMQNKRNFRIKLTYHF